MSKENFSEDIIVRKSAEEKRLNNLKQLYDNRKIAEEEISDEDIKKLIEIYDKEIEKLRFDTERRRKNIVQIIKT